MMMAAKTLLRQQQPGGPVQVGPSTPDALLRGTKIRGEWAVRGRQATGPHFHFEIPTPCGRGAGQSTFQFSLAGA